MGKIALTQLTSLDGVMQSPGPADVPFKYRGCAGDPLFGETPDKIPLRLVGSAPVGGRRGEHDLCT
jgi:hypothetical protein